MAKVAAEWLEANKKASPAEKAAFARAMCDNPLYWTLVKPNVYVIDGDVLEYIGPEAEKKEDTGTNA